MSGTPDRYAREAFDVLLNKASELSRTYKLRCKNPYAFVATFEDLQQELTAFQRKAWDEIRIELRRIEILLTDLGAEYNRCLPLAKNWAKHGPPKACY